MIPNSYGFVESSAQTLWLGDATDPASKTKLGVTWHRHQDGTNFVTIQLSAIPWRDENGKIIPKLERVVAKIGINVKLADLMQMIMLAQQSFTTEQVEEFNRQRAQAQGDPP